MEHIQRINYDAYTDPGGREENEDSYDLVEYGENFIAVLMDGLGGQGDGKAASQVVCDNLILCGEDGAFPSVQQIEAAFREANQALMARQQNRFHMKTTALYLCVHGALAVWAHIGDTRLYHFYQGALQDFTLDHSLSQAAVWMGEIQRSEIPGHPGRSRLTRAMGDEDAQPVVHPPVELPPGQHAFLLCSDGFWEYLPDADIQAELAASSGDASLWLQRMRQLHQERHGPRNDNNTAIAVVLEA